MERGALGGVEWGVVDTNASFIYAGVDATFRGLLGDDCHDECRRG